MLVRASLVLTASNRQNLRFAAVIGRGLGGAPAVDGVTAATGGVHALVGRLVAAHNRVVPVVAFALALLPVLGVILLLLITVRRQWRMPRAVLDRAPAAR